MLLLNGFKFYAIPLTVDLDFLVCEDKATPTQSQGQLVVNRVGTKSDTVMCATNGVTYPSLCRLLQDTGNEVVAHTGDCNRDECQGGMVRNLFYI